jgi:hypothetical protein
VIWKEGEVGKGGRVWREKEMETRESRRNQGGKKCDRARLGRKIDDKKQGERERGYTSKAIDCARD